MGTNTVSLTVSGPLGTNTLTRPNYIVITNVPPVTLSIQIVSNQVQLVWREGILQSAGGVTDVYTNIPAATSPYNPAPAEATRFFRVKVR
jgi:PKD repeat protein